MNACVIAVDVGNSAAKLVVGIDPIGAPVGSANLSRSFRIDRAEWAEMAVQWVRDHTPCGTTQWRIASVHRGAAARLSETVRNQLADAEIRLVTRHDLPIVVDVEFPDRVGIDRLVGAAAAVQISSPPLVVIDAGSAITVDWIDPKGFYCGGAIMPGLRLQTKSLATGTDALPDLEWGDDQAIATPGRNTLDAIRLGVLTNVAAGIDRLVEHYSGLVPASLKIEVLVTGGDAKIISSQLKCRHRIEPSLVCRGLLGLTGTPQRETPIQQ